MASPATEKGINTFDARSRPLSPIPVYPSDSMSPTTQYQVNGESSPNLPKEFENLSSQETDTQSGISQAETLPPYREALIVSVVFLGQFTTQVGLGQTLSILYVIGHTFSLAPNNLSWLIAGYSLTLGSFIMLSGRIGDLFGYKPLVVIGYSWFSLWSLIAGLSVYSNRHVLFVFARVFQGLGPAIILPNSLAILGVMYPSGRKKDMIFAIFGATAPVGAIVGAAFAALFAQLLWWPWAFWSFSIVLAGIAALAAFVIPPSTNPREEALDGVVTPPPPAIRPQHSTLRQKFIAMDPLGATAGITSLILFNFAWNQAPLSGWSHPSIPTTLILGILTFILFLYIEARISTYPLIPFDALTTDVCFVLACVACGWSSFGIWAYYCFTFLEQHRHFSPLLTSAQMSPVALSGFLAAVCTGLLLSRVRPAWIMVLALAAFLAGNILLGTAPVSQTYWAQVFVGVLVVPWGMDMSFPAATVILSDGVKREHQGIAASLVNTVVNYSISLGLGFAGTVEREVQGKGDEGGGGTLKGLRAGYYMGMGLSGLGLGLSLVFVAKSYLKKGGVARR